MHRSRVTDSTSSRFPVPLCMLTAGALLIRPALAPVSEAAETATAVPRYWRPAALARQLGFSRQAIYSAIKRGELPAVTIFGALRIRESDVLSYLVRVEGRR